MASFDDQQTQIIIKNLQKQFDQHYQSNSGKTLNQLTNNFHLN